MQPLASARAHSSSSSVVTPHRPIAVAKIAEPLQVAEGLPGGEQQGPCARKARRREKSRSKRTESRGRDIQREIQKGDSTTRKPQKQQNLVKGDRESWYSQGLPNSDTGRGGELQSESDRESERAGRR